MDRDDEKRQILKQSRLFGRFSDAVLDMLVSRLQPCRFAADEVICFKGDESDFMYVLKSGEVDVSVSSADGKMILLGTLQAGDAFGEIGLLDQGPRTATVTARSEAALYRISNADFDAVSRQFGKQEFMVLAAYICALFRGVTDNLEAAVFLDTSARLMRKLCVLCEQGQGERDGYRFSLSMSQETIARMIGVSREAANAAINELESKGLLESGYRCIIVPDIRVLSQHLENGKD